MQPINRRYTSSSSSGNDMRIDRIAAKPGKWRTFSRVERTQSQFRISDSPLVPRNACFSREKSGEGGREFEIKLKKEKGRERVVKIV